MQSALLRHIKLSGANRVVILLTFSDIFTWGSYYIISVISGIYLAERLGEDAIQVIGVGTGVYFLTRAVFQIPVGLLTDRLRRDRDEIIVLAVGSIFMGASFVFYPLISSPVVYFALQFLFGLGTAMNLNTWRKLFATNLDKAHAGREYAIYEGLMSLSIAFFSLVAGSIANANRHYFDLVMVVIGCVMMSSFVWALLIFRIKERHSL